MKMILRLLLVLVCSHSLCFAGGDKVGTTGMEFLKIRSAARPLGMNSAFVAVADDISTLAWNVGGLANLSQQEFIFSYFNYIDGIGYYNLGYAIPGKFGTLGFGFSFQSFTLEEMDAQYNSKGEIVMSDMVVSLAYSQKFRELFTLGVGIDVFSSKIGHYTLTSYGVNLGGLYFAPQGFTVGFSVQNIGPKCAYKNDDFIGEKQSLPFTIIMGVSKKLLADKILLSSDIVNDHTLRGNMGAEYRLYKILALRMGYKTGYDTGSFTFGMGINFEPQALDHFQFDYAYLPMGDLGATHCVSIITRF